MVKLLKDFGDGTQIVIKASKDPSEQELFGHAPNPGNYISIISGRVLDISEYVEVLDTEDVQTDPLTALLPKGVQECL